MVKSEMLEMDQEQTNPILNNPWAKIEFVEEFLYYCCPECQVLSHCQHFKDQNSFIQHVFASHPKAKTFLDKMNHQINIKSEPLEADEIHGYANDNQGCMPQAPFCELPLPDPECEVDNDCNEQNDIVCDQEYSNCAYCDNGQCNPGIHNAYFNNLRSILF